MRDVEMGKSELTIHVLGTVNVRNDYVFIKRNDTNQDVFVHWTAINTKKPTGSLQATLETRDCGVRYLEKIERFKNF